MSTSYQVITAGGIKTGKAGRDLVMVVGQALDLLEHGYVTFIRQIESGTGTSGLIEMRLDGSRDEVSTGIVLTLHRAGSGDWAARVEQIITNRQGATA